MTTYYRAPDPINSTQFIPGGAVPANGGQLFFYDNLTTTKRTIAKDPTGSAIWSNPIVLDSGGNLPSGGSVFLTAGVTYTVVFAPANDTDPPASPYWTKDNIDGINDVSMPAQELVTSYTVSGLTSIIAFNSAIDWQRYTELQFIITDVTPSVYTTEPFSAFLSDTGGSSYISSYGYMLLGQKISQNTTFSITTSINTTVGRSILLSDPMGLSTTNRYFGTVTLMTPYHTSQINKFLIINHASYFDASTQAFSHLSGSGIGVISSAAGGGVNGIAFGMASSSPLISGIVQVMGIPRP